MNAKQSFKEVHRLARIWANNQKLDWGVYDDAASKAVARDTGMPLTSYTGTNAWQVARAARHSVETYLAVTDWEKCVAVTGGHGYT